MPGRLTVCPTPIGNVEDLSPRGRRALSEADLVACEDTRRTGRLYERLDIPRPTSSWSFVSSRQTAAGRLGARAARAASESGRRRGDSKATIVSAERSTRSSSPARRGR